MYRIAAYEQHSAQIFLADFYLEDISDDSLKSLMLFIIDKYATYDEECTCSLIKLAEEYANSYTIKINWISKDEDNDHPKWTQTINLAITKITIKKDLLNSSQYLTHSKSFLRDFTKDISKISFKK